MLSWPSAIEWLEDNQWRPIESAPMGRRVDVHCHKFDPRQRDEQKRWTARRACGAFWDGHVWSGLPEGYVAKFWTDPLSTARIRELAA